jgi:hypothetical protein
MKLSKFTKQELREIFKIIYSKYPPNNLKKRNLITILQEEEKLSGSGFGSFFRNIASKASNVIQKTFNNKKDTNIKYRLADIGARQVLNYRKSYTNETRETLNKFGNSKIENITIVRTPVTKAIITVLNALSFGLFKELMKTHGYDTMFHLGLLMTINNQRVVVEKLAEINVSTNYKQLYNEASETLTLTLNGGDLTLNQMIEKTRNFMGEKNFYDYDAFTNNCQNFISNILTANSLNSPKYQDFLYQDMAEMYKTLESKAGYLSKIAKFSTRMGSLWNRLTGAGVLEKKEFPINYGINAEKVINKIAFNVNDVKVMGSMAIKSTLYPSDFDLFESVKVKSINTLANEFKDKIEYIIQKNNIYLGDVKLGEIEELKVINDGIYFKNSKPIGYNYNEAKNKLNKIKPYITNDEYKKGLSVLKENPNVDEFNIIKNVLRFHVLRWNAKELLNGYKKIAGQKITIEDALKTNGLFKMDVIAFVRDKFMEFSIIYDLRDENNKRINNFRVNVSDSLTENTKTYIAQGKYYKALKRYYSKMKHEYTHNKGKREKLKDNLDELTAFFNSNVGLLNSVLIDVETMLLLFESSEEYPINKAINIMNSFIYRLSNVYTVNDFLKQEKTILKLIRQTIQQPDKLQTTLNTLKTKLDKIINDESLKFLNKKNIKNLKI